MLGLLLSLLVAWVGIGRKRTKALLSVSLFGLIALSLIYYFPVKGPVRSISINQLSENVASVVSSSEQRENLNDTKTWRIAWWKTVIRYTFLGDQFWFGKGFGKNIANDDGFQVLAGSPFPLRNPHSTYLNILARSGVPGLVLWLLFELSWLASTVKVLAAAAFSYETRSLKLISWTAALIVLSLSVSMVFSLLLEAPEAAFLFWTCIGIGLAASCAAQPPRTTTLSI